MLRRLTVLAVVLSSAACSQTLQPGSPEYEMEHRAHNYAVAVNVSELESARLALVRGTQTDVRKFAQLLVDDHSNSMSQHMDMARSFGEEWEIDTRPSTRPANGQPAPPTDVNLSDMDRDELLESDLSAELTHNHEVSMANLRQQSGAEFDRAFIDRQIAVHRKVLARIDELLPTMLSDQMRTQLENDRVMMAEHLRAAEQLKAKH